jgi:hypothetical protein
MMSSRDASLEDLAQKFSYIRKEAFGKQSASNGILNLHVTLEPVLAQRMFIIRQDTVPSPPEVIFDATLELHQLDLNLEIVSILEEGGQNALEEERLIQKNRSERRWIRTDGERLTSGERRTRQTGREKEIASQGI